MEQWTVLVYGYFVAGSDKTWNGTNQGARNKENLL